MVFLTFFLCESLMPVAGGQHKSSFSFSGFVLFLLQICEFAWQLSTHQTQCTKLRHTPWWQFTIGLSAADTTHPDLRFVQSGPVRFYVSRIPTLALSALHDCERWTIATLYKTLLALAMVPTRHQGCGVMFGLEGVRPRRRRTATPDAQSLSHDAMSTEISTLNQMRVKTHGGIKRGNKSLGPVANWSLLFGPQRWKPSGVYKSPCCRFVVFVIIVVIVIVVPLPKQSLSIAERGLHDDKRPCLLLGLSMGSVEDLAIQSKGEEQSFFQPTKQGRRFLPFWPCFLEHTATILESAVIGQTNGGGEFCDDEFTNECGFLLRTFRKDRQNCC